MVRLFAYWNLAFSCSDLRPNPEGKVNFREAFQMAPTLCEMISCFPVSLSKNPVYRTKQEVVRNHVYFKNLPIEFSQSAAFSKKCATDVASMKFKTEEKRNAQSNVFLWCPYTTISLARRQSVTSAINRQSNTSDERRLVGCQEADRFGHFLGESWPAERMSLLTSRQELK